MAPQNKLFTSCWSVIDRILFFVFDIGISSTNFVTQKKESNNYFMNYIFGVLKELVDVFYSLIELSLLTQRNEAGDDRYEIYWL